VLKSRKTVKRYIMQFFGYLQAPGLIFALSLELFEFFVRVVSVPDLVSRIRDVVLVRRIFSPGKPQGVGNLEWGGNGEGWKGGVQFTSNLGPRWTGSYHTRRVSK
jgi:hypothetical protein